MSGGVDSSVSAALLKEVGYDVTGVFIKTWSPDWLPCTWREERRDAMRVAAKLKIPLLTLDLENEYKKGVVDYMIKEYQAGLVPNPDVMCNKVIKFGGFFDFAMKNGADFVATGHYARVRREPASLAHGKGGGFAAHAGSLLLKSRDSEKDQTYFLWTLSQRELSRTLFPVGDLQKSEVRKLAKKFDLPNAEKKDSQGLCFMGKVDVKDFLAHYIEERRGDVVNEAGEAIGTHNGATFFTIGERHGFTINKKGTEDSPYYVVGKDIKKNFLIVSNKKNSGEILKKEIIIHDVNWNQGFVPDFTKKYFSRIRYRQDLQECRIEDSGNGLYKIIFKRGALAPAPGQSVVFYNGDICLGGGVIVSI